MAPVVKFGVGYDFRNVDPARGTFVDLYARALDRIALADELGYDYVFVGEHHFTPEGHAPSLFPIFAAIAARTRRIRIASYVLLLPLHHPLNVAEDVAVVDTIASGRLELGVGLGYRAEEFDAFGVDRGARAGLMDESCQILLKAWTEDHWDFHGAHFDLHDITVVPKPVGPTGRKLWISARNPRAARRAARFRAPLMIAPAEYTEDPAAVHAAYANELTSAGDDPGRYDVMGSFTVHVLGPGEAPPPPAPDSRAEQYLAWFSQDGDLAGDAQRLADPPAHLRRYMGFTGEAPACVAAIEELVAEVPYTTLLVGGISAGQMRRFAEDVMPHFERG